MLKWNIETKEPHQSIKKAIKKREKSIKKMKKSFQELDKITAKLLLK